MGSVAARLSEGWGLSIAGDGFLVAATFPFEGLRKCVQGKNGSLQLRDRQSQVE